MDSHQQELLQTTHDSTIRQEIMLQDMSRRLAVGDEKFDSHGRRIKALEDDSKEQATEREALAKRRRRNGKIATAVIGIASVPVAATMWEKIVKFMGW